MTLIDVTMAVLSGEATVAESIASVLNGAHRAVMVVVDEGSTDRTADIVSRTCAAVGRVCDVRQDDRGIAAEHRRAFDVATSLHVSQIDADNTFELDRLLAFSEHRSGRVAVCGPARHIDAQERRARVVVRLRPSVDSEGVELFRRLLEIGELHNVDVVVILCRSHASSIGSTLVDLRILVIDPQLVALSARRRRSGRPDVALCAKRRAACCAAQFLTGIRKVAGFGLFDGEQRKLRVSIALEVLAWLEDLLRLSNGGDCAFIRTAYEARSDLGGVNLAPIRRTLSVTAPRLMAAGDLKRVARHASPVPLSTAVARAALRRRGSNCRDPHRSRRYARCYPGHRPHSPRPTRIRH